MGEHIYVCLNNYKKDCPNYNFQANISFAICTIYLRGNQNGASGMLAFLVQLKLIPERYLFSNIAI